MLARGEVHDPKIGFITLTRVQVSPDLQVARVYYTSLGDAAARKDTQKALDRATPFLRRQIGSRVQLRRVPEIEFRFDESIAHQDRIEQILQELHQEEATRAADSPAADAPTSDPPMTTTSTDATSAQVADAIRARRRFVVVSHARPDGDAIGSQVAMALALRALGKDVRMVAHDPAPQQMQDFPAVADIQLVDHLDDLGDAVIFMECGDVRRPGVTGLDKGFVINIDHHPGNAMYGAMNCIDLTAAACGEIVFDLIAALGVPLSVEMATHVYLAILTDTGGFHYSHISPRTFDICRRCVEAGLDPTAVSRAIYDNNNLGRVRIWGAVLNDMQLSPDGRVADAAMDRALAARCGATYDDTEGLINFPLTVKEIQAVVFFKESGPGDWRISMRSKGDVNVNAIAREFGGGGHTNASGCGATGDLAHLVPLFEQKLVDAVNRARREP